MAWYWGGKTKGLYEYIMLQADNEGAWELALYTLRHKPSRVEVWVDGFVFFEVDIYDDFVSPGRQHVGFSLVQKWKIHRKLNKLRQKIRNRRTLDGFDSKADKYMAKMVGGVLEGNK